MTTGRDAVESVRRHAALGAAVMSLLTAGAFVRPEPAAKPERGSADAAVDFARDIRPILADNCFKCHGPDQAAREGGLRLDTLEGLLAGGDSGRPAAVRGDADASELIRRIFDSSPSDVMPPPDSGRTLAGAQKDALRRWVAAGAPWERHWAFEPPVRPPAPGVSDEAWCRGELDRFVLARLDAEGLEPSPEADRPTLIRRVSLDLTGLPPTLEDVDAFLADEAPGAYERLVDRLLHSPRFGERWARVWLDLARYADTKGYEKDDRRTVWPYRDWVIRAFNADMPFDEFTARQLAGDLLPDATTDDVLATAFHRNTMTNDEGGTDDEEFRVAAVKDRVATTMSVWMGLTMSCAECHTHKYDPLTQREYYELYAFFNQTQDADRPDEAPTRLFGTAGQEEALAAVRERIASRAGDSAAEGADPALDSLRREEQALAEAMARVPVMAELAPAERRATHLLEKGSFLSPGEAVEPGVPAALHPFPEHSARNRLGLARWLVAPENPMTARVTVNRFWEQFFGTGLVETVEDFGAQGSPPSHPELLDWLALEFAEGGWSVKSLCREIVTSATYRQSSDATADLLERDPRNLLLARGPRFRLEAELIRDQALAASGLLGEAMFGPPVYPPQPEGVWMIVYSGDSWRTSEGEDRRRRGLYTFWRRTSPYPSMTTFDAPSREVCTPRRIRTNTPLQALVTLNDPVFVEAAQGLARRMMFEGGPLAGERVALGFRLCLARRPTAEEVDVLLALVAGEHAHYKDNPEAAALVATDPLGALPAGVDRAEAAAWTVAAGVLLNLDEFLTRR